MATAPPEAHTGSLFWVSFFTTDPAPESYRAVQRMCASSYCPCCLLHKPKFQVQSHLFPIAHLSILLHPPFPIPINPHPLPCPKWPAVSERFCSRGYCRQTCQDGRGRPEGGEVPINAIYPVPVLHNPG